MRSCPKRWDGRRLPVRRHDAMAYFKTYPVPAWVRVFVCIVSFSVLTLAILTFSPTPAGFCRLIGITTLCGVIGKCALTKQ